MELLKHGKTKDVYKLPNGDILLRFKDTITGSEDGESDPGGNLVVGSVAGVGTGALRVTSYYFEILKKLAIPTHYIGAEIDKGEMTVRPAVTFGKGLEFVIRYKAVGSFVRRFGDYIEEGASLGEGVFEVTLKDDAKNDPPATKEILEAIHLLSAEQYDLIEGSVRKVCGIVRDDLAKKGLELIDIKVEYGLVDGKVALIDEISAGNMRVYKGGKKLSYMQLNEYFK